ncbi:MAG: preprotein translocase subunit YajC [Clostridia bacterium]|nr:preprotein translocase subunit YajC [Clostridia bacterium]
MLHLFLTDAAAAAADGTATANTTAQGISTIVMLVVMVAVFYFFMYRPQKKQEKETNEMRNSLKVGDEITTIGGIIGKVISIKEETVMIETGRDGTKIRILRNAIKSIDVKAEDC